MKQKLLRMRRNESDKDCADLRRNSPGNVSSLCFKVHLIGSLVAEHAAEHVRSVLKSVIKPILNIQPRIASKLTYSKDGNCFTIAG